MCILWKVFSILLEPPSESCEALQHSYTPPEIPLSLMPMCVMAKLCHAAQQVRTLVPGVEGQGGWGYQTRSLEWWRSLTNANVHAARGHTQSRKEDLFLYHSFCVKLCKALFPVSPAGQLSAGQRCAAAPHCPWTPSGSAWTVKCFRRQVLMLATNFREPLQGFDHKQRCPPPPPHGCPPSLLYLAPGVFMDWLCISRLRSFSSSARIATRALDG